ncbi:MAG TPA: FAD-dependent oxidoreductase [Candidatus Binatia bacterium]|nr:FAD-dependent oxidoreductase [Candidatus Binatia bacterium]
MYDLIIIGTGASGLAAAVYAGRYKMKTLVIGKEFGGETSTAWIISNYPGLPEIDGYELMTKMRDQAKSNGAEVIEGEVTKIEKQGHCISVFAGDTEYQSKTLILALGTERRKLGLPNEKDLVGKGVHYCVTCDGPLYTNKTIAIIGGGDASVKGANLAGVYAKKVYLITREKELRAEPINYDQMKKLGDKVEVIFETQIKEIVPKNTGMGLEKIVLDTNGKTGDLTIDGLFVEIGAIPNVELAKSIGVELDDRGYIKVDNFMQTNIDGVFAAGDTTNHFGAFKQDITAAATGAMAATSAFKDLGVHGGEVCEVHAKPIIKEHAQA